VAGENRPSARSPYASRSSAPQTAVGSAHRRRLTCPFSRRATAGGSGGVVGLRLAIGMGWRPTVGCGGGRWASGGVVGLRLGRAAGVADRWVLWWVAGFRLAARVASLGYGWAGRMGWLPTVGCGGGSLRYAWADGVAADRWARWRVARLRLAAWVASLSYGRALGWRRWGYGRALGCGSPVCRWITSMRDGLRRAHVTKNRSEPTRSGTSQVRYRPRSRTLGDDTAVRRAWGGPR
jgi:hypothetical protein